MYYCRIVILIDKNLSIKGITESDSIIIKEGNVECTVKFKDANNNRRIIYTYGPFQEKYIAEDNANKLYIKILKSYIKHCIPITISDNIGIHDISKRSNQLGTLTDAGKQYMRKALNISEDIEVFDEVLGMKVYDIKGNISEAKFGIHEIHIRKEFNSFDIIEENISYKFINAYSLVNASNLTNDKRIQFILLITAIESLVAEDEKESNEYIAIIDILKKKIVQDKQLITEFKKIICKGTEYNALINKVKNVLGLSKKKSIADKCISLIGRFNFTDKYNNKSAEEFFSECYKIRSSFIHAGTLSVIINDFIHPLNLLVISILTEIEKNLTTAST